MDSSFSRQKKLKEAVERIVDHIQHLPKGYLFWFHLTDNRKRSIRRRWISYIHEALFNDAIKKQLTLLILDSEGRPRDNCIELYYWIVELMYDGDESKLYQIWLRLNK